MSLGGNRSGAELHDGKTLEKLNTDEIQESEKLNEHWTKQTPQEPSFSLESLGFT